MQLYVEEHLGVSPEQEGHSQFNPVKLSKDSSPSPPRGHSGKESSCQCRDSRDVCSILGLERSPGVGNGNLLQ